MITEDYVSFETAKLLKEKGFDVECRAYWDSRIDMLPNEHENLCFVEEPIAKPCDNMWSITRRYLAPTLQMAMKWLVQEYRLYVNVAPSVEGYYWTEKWHSYVEDLNKRYPFGRFINTFNSPEQACEAAIKYCLENLI